MSKRLDKKRVGVAEGLGGMPDAYAQPSGDTAFRQQTFSAATDAAAYGSRPSGSPSGPGRCKSGTPRERLRGKS